MLNQLSSIVLCCNLKIQYGVNRAKELIIENFSSFKFFHLFLDSYLPSSLTCSILDNTKVHQELETCIDVVLEYISNNRGFTVVGWYKREEFLVVSKG